MNKIEEAKIKAREIIKKYDLNPNFKIELLAKLLGIDVQEREISQNVSGLIKREGKESGKPIIVINVYDTPERKRFSIAHEIGHYLLHPTNSLMVDTDQSLISFRDERSALAIDIREIQANQFAAELLMPTDDVIDQLKDILNSGETKDDLLFHIPELAEKYGVSNTAMTIKVGNLLS